MDTSDFVRRVTGTAGHYCILAIGQNNTRRQKFYSTVDEAVREALALDEAGWNVYFALGRFTTPTTRTAENIQQMRAFYLDLDCGPQKDYADQTSALQALRSFVRQARLPKPVIVNSGRGIHVYWPLSEPVDRATWLPIATKLKQLCATLGLRADAAITADAARVLRVPGTHNHKDSPPKPVEVLGGGEHVAVDIEQFADAIGAQPGAAPEPVDMPPVPLGVAALSGRGAVMDALIGNTATSFKKIARKSAAGTGCAQIALLLETPEAVPEPLWRAGVSIAARCVEKKAIHWLSRGHPEYNPADTERKAAGTKGPYLCTRFDEINPGVCSACPNRARIKSPIVLGNELVESDYLDEEGAEPTLRGDTDVSDPTSTTVPRYPAPYVRGAKGGVYLKHLDENGEEAATVVWNHDLYVVRRLLDPELGETIEMRHHLPRDGVRSFVVPLYNVTSKEEFRKILATNGVVAINREVDALMSYTQTWVKELQYRERADNANRQYGWLPDFEAFVLGNKMIYPKKVVHNAPTASTRSTIDAFTPKGTLEGWKEAVNFYNRPGFEIHQLVVCAGFGSVLMKLMPVHASLIHLWSKDSGFGKTTAQQAALSIWGNPALLLLREKDTYNSRMMRADAMRSLPVCMDEMTNITPKECSDLIYQITGGQQRNRMAANGNTERFRGDPWNLLFISSSNQSLIDTVALGKAMPKAEAQRVLEIEVSRLFTLKTDKVQTDAFSRQILENYGHAGEIFIKYVIANLAEVQILVDTIQKQLDAAAALGPENRYWSAAMAVSLAAGIICTHRLGLLGYDMSVLTKYVISKVLRTNQAASASMALDSVEMVTDYAYHNWGRILQIRSTADLRGLHGNGLDALVVPEQLPKGTDFIGRYETDMKHLYLLIKPFKEWLAEQQVNYQSVFGDLVKRVGAKKVRMRLSKGTHMLLPPTDVLELPINIEEPPNG